MYLQKMRIALDGCDMRSTYTTGFMTAACTPDRLRLLCPQCPRPQVRMIFSMVVPGPDRDNMLLMK